VTESTVKPLLIEDYVSAVASASALRIRGQNTHADWRLKRASSYTELDMRGLAGIIDYSPNDQVVAVRAGTTLGQLQEELGKEGQCIPILQWDGGWSLATKGTVAGKLSMNLPHELEAECGSWRDWVLGMTLILADGTVAKTGSHAVKNVAGYDIHKLMIGARGTLAVIGEVILRTYPLKSLPDPKVQVHLGKPGSVTWVQRVVPTDFEAARANPHPGLDISGTSTIYRHLPEGETPTRFPSDWIQRSGHIDIEDSTTIAYMKRAKAILDPTNKLNPGEFGFI
jgi:glycolate oxidase FAD binding subunit